MICKERVITGLDSLWAEDGGKYAPIELDGEKIVLKISQLRSILEQIRNHFGLHSIDHITVVGCKLRTREGDDYPVAILCNGVWFRDRHLVF